MRKERLIILVLLLLVPALSWGQAKVGTAGVQFLKVGVSARAMGMAEAFIGVADDASALYYNPAGLVQLKNPDFMFTHIVYPAGIQFEYLGGVWPIRTLSAAVGLQATLLHTDDMDETTPLMPYGTGRTFTASDMAIGATYAQRLTNKFSVGATAKFIQERLAEQKASGMGFDVGTFYNTGWKSVIISMSISNFGPDMKFVDAPFPMPINFKFGGSMRVLDRDPHQMILAVEGWHPNDNLEQASIGLEYGFAETGFLRIGKKINGYKRYSWDDYLLNNDKDPFIEYPIINENGSPSADGLCLGAGIKVQLPTMSLKLDYAFTNVDKLGTNHFFTLGLGYGQYGRKAYKPKVVAPPVPVPVAPVPIAAPAMPDTIGLAARLAAEALANAEAEAAAAAKAEAEAKAAAELADRNSLKPIYMAYGKAELNAEARQNADFDAALMQKYPGWNLLIEGHCDERGTEEFNMALGEKRAQAVKNHLVNKGISAARLATVSYGESRPLDPDHTEEAWAKNRRVVLVIQ